MHFAKCLKTPKKCLEYVRLSRVGKRGAPKITLPRRDYQMASRAGQPLGLDTNESPFAEATSPISSTLVTVGAVLKGCTTRRCRMWRRVGGEERINKRDGLEGMDEEGTGGKEEKRQLKKHQKAGRMKGGQGLIRVGLMWGTNGLCS